MLVKPAFNDPGVMTANQVLQTLRPFHPLCCLYLKENKKNIFCEWLSQSCVQLHNKSVVAADATILKHWVLRKHDSYLTEFVIQTSEKKDPVCTIKLYHQTMRNLAAILRDVLYLLTMKQFWRNTW